MATSDAPERDSRELTVRILKDLIASQPLKQLHFRLWDGSYWPEEASNPRAATLVLKHPGALREMLLGGSEVALAEAYLKDDFDVEGDPEAAFEFAEIVHARTSGWSKKLSIAHHLHQLPSRPADTQPTGPRKAQLKDKQHSLSRDQAAVQFHYDLSNDFYALWLDSRKIYSCAYFKDERDDLETAQRNKLDIICRKLALKPGMKLLDIGCGWGGLLLHAATCYGVTATGITLSERQAEYAREQIENLHLTGKVEVLVRDYRAVEGREIYDAIVSVGMVEHVGSRNLPHYYRMAHRLLKPGGLFLNHGIGTGIIASPNHGASFIDEYVFPDSELVPISEMLEPVESEGFEIRDVENLREHYAMTLRHWVRRIEARHEEALNFVNEPVYRTWRLYMSGSAYRFSTAQLAVYQTLLAKLNGAYRGNYPLTRAAWYSKADA